MTTSRGHSRRAIIVDAANRATSFLDNTNPAPATSLSPVPVPDEELPGQLQLLSNRTPRYLFRVWSDRSGGMAGLYTVDAITPMAFYGRSGPSSIFELSRAELMRAIRDHINERCCGKHFKT